MDASPLELSLQHLHAADADMLYRTSRTQSETGRDADLYEDTFTEEGCSGDVGPLTAFDPAWALDVVCDPEQQKYSSDVPAEQTCASHASRRSDSVCYESFNELHLYPQYAWEFPLSRQERLHKLVALLDECLEGASCKMKEGHRRAAVMARLQEELQQDACRPMVDFPMDRREKLRRLISIQRTQAEKLQEADVQSPHSKAALQCKDLESLISFIAADCHAVNAARRLSRQQCVQIMSLVQLLQDPDSCIVVQAVMGRLQANATAIRARRQMLAMRNGLHSELISHAMGKS